MTRVRGEDGKFVKAEGEGDGGGTVVEEPTGVSIGDLVGGELDGSDTAPPAEGASALEAGAVVTPDATQPAAPAVEDAGAVTEEEPQLVQLDGGGFQLGKFKADTVEQLVVELEKARRGAENLVGKKVEEVIGTNPWLAKDAGAEDDDDEFDVVDGQDFTQQVAVSVAEALAQAGVIGGQQAQVDPMQAAMTSLAAAEQVIANEQATEQDFAAVVGALCQHAPQDKATRERVLAEWGKLNPYEAATVRAELNAAERQFSIDQQRQVAAQKEQEAVTHATELQNAYKDGEQSFLHAHPEAAQYQAGINAWFEQPGNAALARRVQGDRAAIHAMFETALNAAQWAEAASPAAAQQVAQQFVPQVQQPGAWPGQQQVQVAPGVTLPAGVLPNVSEQAGMMPVVQQYVDPAAILRAQQAQSRDLGGLEAGGGAIDVSLSNPNSPEATNQSFTDMLGIGLVG